MVSEDSEVLPEWEGASAFPADCPHRTHCHLDMVEVAPDTRSSQHIARFCNGLGRCGEGWGVSPSPAVTLLRLTVIVTAAVHRGFSSELPPA